MALCFGDELAVDALAPPLLDCCTLLLAPLLEAAEKR